jgi:hypothetical protein
MFYLCYSLRSASAAGDASPTARGCWGKPFNFSAFCLPDNRHVIVCNGFMKKRLPIKKPKNYLFLANQNAYRPICHAGQDAKRGSEVQQASENLWLNARQKCFAGWRCRTKETGRDQAGY